MLRPLQAVALAELAVWGGLFAPLPVGTGKTLIMALAARVLPTVRRPLFVMPAALIPKTHIEFAEYRKSWVLPPLYQILSYQELGRVGSATYLEDYRPDLIVADEAHGWKNPTAGTTRRGLRYLETHRPIFVSMTGTPFSTSIRDFAHLTAAALPRTNPLPTRWSDLDEWARVLDVDVAEHRRLRPGALELFCAPGEDVREGFARRLGDTPGVVVSGEPQLPIPLDLDGEITPLDDVQSQAIAELRRSWETPDREVVPDGPSMWRHVRELATGFYQVWEPRAPRDWREARRAWACECREILGTNRRQLDTEDQLCRYVDHNPGEHPLAEQLLTRWREVKPTFAPNSVPVWISDALLDWLAARATRAVTERGPVLVWTERPAVGERLAARLGVPYYGEEGVCAAAGRPIEAHRHAQHGPIAVVAREPNSAGRNLQAWANNIILDVTKSARRNEQLIGRTHRPGQTAPRVTVTVLFRVREDVEAYHAARERAQVAAALTRQPQKILHANLDRAGSDFGIPDLSTLVGSPEPRWQKSKPPANKGDSRKILDLLGSLE